MKPIYLDYAAATPLDPDVLALMQPYFAERFHNPSATYLEARNVARQGLDSARQLIASRLGAKPPEIIFTAGGTEANNLAIQGVMRKYPKGEVLVSAIEHESILAPAKLFNHGEIPVTTKGIIKLEALKKMINSETVLISAGMVNNELGTLQPLREISLIVEEERKDRQKKGHKTPLYLHTDAAQAPNYFDMHVSRLGVDLLSLNAGKIYGPKQTGALFVKAGVILQPLILGGGQESGLRSGTENVAGAVGMAAALDRAQERRHGEAERVFELKKIFLDMLTNLIPAAEVNGDAKHTAPHIINVSFPGFDNERLMMELDEAGIQVATGSACAADSGEPSHVLKAIGLPDRLARSSLRFSFGRATTKKDIEVTARTLQKLIKS